MYFPLILSFIGFVNHLVFFLWFVARPLMLQLIIISMFFVPFKILCPSDYCKGRETLQNLCEQIAGDALLYSLFKENADPVKCPLRGRFRFDHPLAGSLKFFNSPLFVCVQSGPFTFTYNRGHGECKNPVSNIESCTEDSRLLLNLQACPDVPGTESTGLFRGLAPFRL